MNFCNLARKNFKKQNKKANKQYLADFQHIFDFQIMVKVKKNKN